MPFVSSAARISVSYPGGVSLVGDIAVSGTESDTVLQWRAPPGILSRQISIVVVGGGRGYDAGSGQWGLSGKGGDLRYYNNYVVQPNRFYEIQAGKRGTEFNRSGGTSYFKDGDNLVVFAGDTISSSIGGPIGGGDGGSGTSQFSQETNAGGGGAGGYAGNGSSGGDTLLSYGRDPVFNSGAGAGARAGAGNNAPADVGGGVGLNGIGLTGDAQGDIQGSLGSFGTYGGGAGSLINGAGPGGVRIVWGTSPRYFPSFNVRQSKDYFPLIYTHSGFNSQISYSYVVPEGVESVALMVIGGGGGSDTVYQQPDRASGGGGAGGFIWGENIDVSPGDVLNILVGKGGAGGIPSNIRGKTGGTSSVTLTGAGARNFSVSALGGTGANSSSAGSNGSANSTGTNGTFYQSVTSYQPTFGVSGVDGYGGNGGAPNGLTGSAPPTAPINNGGYAGAGYLFNSGGWSTSPAAINPLLGAGGLTSEGNTNAGYGAGASGAWNNFTDGYPGSNGVVVVFPNQLLRPSQSSLDTRAGSGFWLAR